MRLKGGQANSAKAQPKADSPKTGKKLAAAAAGTADGGCPIVAPPDPKMLPKPTGFFNSLNAKNGSGPHKPRQAAAALPTAPTLVPIPVPVSHLPEVLLTLLQKRPICPSHCETNCLICSWQLVIVIRYEPTCFACA